MHQKMRELSRKLDLATYAKDTTVRFKWASIDLAAGLADSQVRVPLPIAYRLYHLGRAYDLHQLKNLHPDRSTDLSFIEVQLLILELKQVVSIVADPVIAHYAQVLIPYLARQRSETKDRLVMHRAEPTR
jgi:hypothetical protein